MNQKMGINLHVVLADDNLDHCVFFEKVIRNIDGVIQLTCVSNGDDLLKLLKERSVDLLFLDLRMPCKSGYDCLEEIKQDPELKDLVVVIYSHSSNRSDIEHAFMLDADFYVVKPFTADHLANALKALVGTNVESRQQFHRHYFINNRFVPFTTMV